MYLKATIFGILALLQFATVLSSPASKVLKTRSVYYANIVTSTKLLRDLGETRQYRRASSTASENPLYPKPQSGSRKRSQITGDAHTQPTNNMMTKPQQVKNSTNQQLKEFCTTVSNSQYLGTPLYSFKEPSLDHLDASGVQDWIDDKCVSYQHKNYPQYNPDASGHFDDDKTKTKNLIVENGGRIPGTQSEYAITCENVKIKGEQWYSGNETLAQTKEVQENNIKGGTTRQVLASQGIQSTPGVAQCSK